jgi:trans-aconitate methyltransferase
MTGTVDFEALYRRDPDPWGYTTSAYERHKYAATLKACGEGPFAAALELGGSIGVFSELLAPRCRSLTTIDSAPTAVGQARHRLAGREDVKVVRGEIPQAIPPVQHDLVVASEVLYYMTPERFEQTLATLERTLAGEGRLVAVHWRRHGPERPLTADQVHEALRHQSWLTAVEDGATDDYLLDVLERA